MKKKSLRDRIEGHNFEFMVEATDEPPNRIDYLDFRKYFDFAKTPKHEPFSSGKNVACKLLFV